MCDLLLFRLSECLLLRHMIQISLLFLLKLFRLNFTFYIHLKIPRIAKLAKFFFKSYIIEDFVCGTSSSLFNKNKYLCCFFLYLNKLELGKGIKRGKEEKGIETLKEAVFF